MKLLASTLIKQLHCVLRNREEMANVLIAGENLFAHAAPPSYGHQYLSPFTLHEKLSQFSRRVTIRRGLEADRVGSAYAVDVRGETASFVGIDSVLGVGSCGTLDGNLGALGFKDRGGRRRVTETGDDLIDHREHIGHQPCPSLYHQTIMTKGGLDSITYSNPVFQFDSSTRVQADNLESLSDLRVTRQCARQSPRLRGWYGE